MSAPSHFAPVPATRGTARRESPNTFIRGKPTQPDPRPARPPPGPAPRPVRQASRIGKVAVNAYFPPAVRDLLKLLAIERQTTQQELVAEAVDDLFAKHGLPEIARADPDALQARAAPLPQPRPDPAPETGGMYPVWFLGSGG